MQKEKALDSALVQIEKQYGKGAIMLMNDAASRIQVETISTGCIELDAALGVGGVPEGSLRSMARSPPVRPPLHST